MKYENVVAYWQEKKFSDETINAFGMEFTFHSNGIGNPETAYEDVKHLYETDSVMNYTGSLRTLIEIENQKYMRDFLQEKLAAKEFLSVELVKAIHAKLMDRCYDNDIYADGERPGKFKRDGKAIREELEDVCSSAREMKKTDIIRAAAYLHLNFEEIRPFSDGNGRVGEVLMNYFLLFNNYPPAIIFKEDKEKYFSLLKEFDETKNIEHFIEFLQAQTVKAWEKYM